MAKTCIVRDISLSQTTLIDTSGETNQNCQTFLGLDINEVY